MEFWTRKKKKSNATRSEATLGLSVPSASTSALSLEIPESNSSSQTSAKSNAFTPKKAIVQPSPVCVEETPGTPPTSQYCPSSSAHTSLSRRQLEKRPAVPQFDEHDEHIDDADSPPSELDLLIGQTSSILLAGNESLKAVIEAREQLKRFHALDTFLDRGLDSHDSLIRERLDMADHLEEAFEQLVEAVNDHLGLQQDPIQHDPSKSRHIRRPRAPSIALSAPELRLPPPASRLGSLAEEEGDYHTAVESLAPPSQAPSVPSLRQNMYSTLFGAPVADTTPIKKPRAPSSAESFLGDLNLSTPTSVVPELTHSPESPPNSTLDTPPAHRSAPLTSVSTPSVVSADMSDPFLDAKAKIYRPSHHRRTSSQRSVSQIGPAARGTEKTTVHSYRDAQKREASAQDRLRHLLAGSSATSPLTSPR